MYKPGTLLVSVNDHFVGERVGLRLLRTAYLYEQKISSDGMQRRREGTSRALANSRFRTRINLIGRKKKINPLRVSSRDAAETTTGNYRPPPSPLSLMQKGMRVEERELEVISR